MDAESKKALRAPFVVTLIAAVLLLVGFFLPYVSAQGDFRESLLEDPSNELGDGIPLTTGSMTDASLFEYSWLYADEIKTAEGDRLVDRIITFSVFVADGALALFLLLFVAAKKPVLIIVFSLLGALSYWLTWVDFNMRGLLEDRYALSVSFYLTIACLVVLLVGAIWLLANKKKLKKQVKTAA